MNIFHKTSWALVVILLGAAGCGEAIPTGTVKGELTLDGEPAAAGSIVSCQHQKTSLPAVGTTNADGTFTLKMKGSPKVYAGEYTVAVLPPQVEISTDELHKMAQEGKSPNPNYEAVPKKYRDSESSGLKLKVSPGENTFDVQMFRE